MAIKIGDLDISKIYVGDLPVDKIYLGNTLIYESTQQLLAPTISLSGDILSIEEVENAEYYDIYVDGLIVKTIVNIDVEQNGNELFIKNAEVEQNGSEVTIL